MFDSLRKRGATYALPSRQTSRTPRTVLWLIAGFVQISASTVQAGFTDITSSAGLSSVDGEYGVAWADYNNDGYLDFYITGADKLYRNNGNGTFSSGPSVSGDNRGVHWGDIDNDGDLDIGVTWNLYLSRNNGNSTFTLLSNSGVGITSINNLGDFAWMDYNLDGNLDMWAPNGGSPYACMYAGDGDGTFTAIGGSSIGLSASTNGESTVTADFDGDGDMDILYRAGSVYLFSNNGDGTFTNVTSSAGISLSGSGGGYNGTAFGDYDNDGDLDLYGGQSGSNKLYRNNGNGTFTDVTSSAGVAGSSNDTMGVAWGDYDNDGDLDLYVAQSGGSNHLYRNNGNSTFTDVASSQGVADSSSSQSRGVAWADFDNDGDIDLLVASDSSDSKLFRNGTNDSSYLKMRVVGAGAGGTNVAGIGVRVDLYDQTGTSFIATRTLGVANGYGSDDPLWAHFGGLSASTTYTLRVYLHSRDIGNPLEVQVVPQDVSTTIGATTIAQMATITETLVAADIPYANDFEGSIGGEWSTTSTDSDPDLTTFVGRFSNGSAQLRVNTVIGEQYQVKLDLYAIDSWNPAAGSTANDYLSISANGSEVFRETFSQRISTFPPTYPNPADQTGQLAFGTRDPEDTDGIYRNITATFTATSAVTTLTFADGLNEGMSDESMGIDNVSVALSRFHDVSVARGFDVQTTTDASYSSGIYWADFDNDGDLDVILGGNSTARRMINNSQGSSFTASTFGTGNERRGAALLDVDNDGDVDVWSGNHNSYYVETCYLNDGSAGFSDAGNLGYSEPNNNEGVAAADVDRDGWCDIVHFSENSNWIGHHQGDPGGSLPRLVGSNDSSEGLNDSGDVGNGDYCSSGDVNNDGYLDFFYHYGSGKLFLSKSSLSFAESANGISIATGNSDKIGSAWGDYDNDGDLDLFAPRHDAGNTGYLWRNDVTWTSPSSGSFTNQTSSAYVIDESGQRSCAWGDYDNDGDLDLYVVTRNQPNRLYANNDDGTFRLVDEGAAIDGDGHDAVFVDYDNDGDLDIAYTREDTTNVLLENRTNDTNYLKVRLIGAGGGGTNVAAVGVRVELWNSAGTVRLGRRDVGVARGFGGTEPFWAHFGGVDPATTYKLKVWFHSRDNSNPLEVSLVPNAVSTTIGSVTIPQMITVTEGDARKRILQWREVPNRT